MSYDGVLSVTDVADRVFMRSSWIYLKDCRQFDALTEDNGRTVELFHLGGGRREGATLVLEVERKCVAFVAGRRRGFRQLGGRRCVPSRGPRRVLLVAEVDIIRPGSTKLGPLGGF